jgi:hypothetical protein
MPSIYRKHGRKPNKTGRNSDHQYWPLPYSMAQSQAFRLLSGSAVKVLIELRVRFNGHNNGRISLSLDEAATLLAMSKSTVKRALEELLKVGFIRLAKRGVFYGRRASEWEMTFESRDGQPATHEWKQWQAPARRKPPKKIKPRYSHGIPAYLDDAEQVPST